MESYLEARLWNDVFVFAQKYIGIPNGTIKQRCYWKRFTLRLKWRKFCMSLKIVSAGLNCGRWDYIF
ncbi:hypothetical protein ACT7DO_24065 [Bacillus pacificus]